MFCKIYLTFCQPLNYCDVKCLYFNHELRLVALISHTESTILLYLSNKLCDL